MSFSIILRRATSSVPSFLICATRTQTNYNPITPLKNNTICQEICGTYIPTLHFSSVSKKSITDQSLLRLIKSKIKSAEEMQDANQVEGIPDGFPFKIKDEPGKQTISLKREDQGEAIKVQVDMPSILTQEYDDSGLKVDIPSIPLVVSVTNSVNGKCLKFTIADYIVASEIHSLVVKDRGTSEASHAYRGPDLVATKKLPSAFRYYLNARGIEQSTSRFLYEYMVNKSRKEYLTWLKNVKSFIEN
ncbi:hypothetical protein AQUCO_05800221v1 [Aquilegia coerulea]|uniref:Mitochondrial glycoprotein n=1 Tax=Aquilegia coerulea TaxID=218851 RepID=A0A2G5CFE2_AQUCA|nr:hypothetical protein AQUCO_05800221v1 [Aquilegia coerulea]PIA29989.1 hypothetical protein AQUCO_05800221v1 [Aquilegia coerulea]